MDYVDHWQERTELPAKQFIAWLGIGASKFHSWRKRYGKVHEHNGKVPRDFWLEDWEKQSILNFHDRHPLDGYRRLTRIISDHGPQFIAKDFKEFIRLSGMTPVRTSPYYPQSNGKLERWHKTVKGDCIRPGEFQTLEQVVAAVTRYVEYYNQLRLHSAIEYVTPADKLAGRAPQILAARDSKLDAARERRKLARQAAAALV
jgi:transposase InsO family protein